MSKEKENSIRKKRGSNIPENETKREHFLRLVNRRMSKTENRITAISKMVRNKQYDVDEDDIMQISKTLHHLVDGIATSYATRDRTNLSDIKAYIK